MNHITVWEVCPRDGFQNEALWIPTEKKLQVIDHIVRAGVTHLEATSFVHPKAIPQLKDAEEIIGALSDVKGIHVRALVPNRKGAERAVAAGVKKLKLMLSATDSHSLSNGNATVTETMKALSTTIEFARGQNVAVSGSISVAFGCPYEGNVPVQTLLAIVKWYEEMGVTEISLADTIGMGNPTEVKKKIQQIQAVHPAMKFSLHLHNTRGLAFANAVAAMEAGVDTFDGSIAGLGGCPYAPGATGNIATEDLVFGLHEMGYQTGIDLDKLLNASAFVKEVVGHDGGSFLLKSGTGKTLLARPDGQIKKGDK